MKWFIFCILLTFGSCTGQEEPASGELAGTISIGPLCPVEQYPVNPACRPTVETFGQWPIAVYTTDRDYVVRIQPDDDGLYTVSLPPGAYIVALEHNQRAITNLPTSSTFRTGNAQPWILRLIQGYDSRNI